MRKDRVQSYPAASLAALSPGSRLRKERTSLSHFVRFPAGVSRLRTKSGSRDIKESSLYFYSDLLLKGGVFILLIRRIALLQ